MMNAYLVSILTWSRPYKTAFALLSVNVIFWFLNHQRPICVISLAALCLYLRYLWKHRIRPEVLVDPPDSEDWVTLSSYEFEQQYLSLTTKLWNHWINLRTENHIMWTAVTCTMWIFLAKLGSQLDFITLLFILSNAAFLLVPLLKICPALPELPSDEGVIKEEDLIPEIPKKTKATTTTSKKASPPPLRSTSTPARDLDLAPHPVRVADSSESNKSQTRRMSPTLSTNLTEGMLTRSISAAAATFVTSGLSSSSSVMSASAAVISSLVSQASSQMSGGTAAAAAEPPSAVSASSHLLSSVLSSSNSGPDSLTPPVMAMPDHEEVADSDPEDEFLFDAKHFDKSSSSSSTSNSFEIINNF